MKLPAYPRTKPSGVEWLGDVPEHWSVVPFKHRCRRFAIYGANMSSDEYVPDGVRFLRTTDIDELGELQPDGVFIEPELAREYLLNDQDILLSRSGTLGRAFVYRSNLHPACAYAGYLVRFVPTARLNTRFLFHFTKSIAFTDWLQTQIIASTIGNVNGQKYAQCPLSLPEREEQDLIAAFLDRETGRVDRLVAKKRELIERLKEKRTALISRTVTRGLPPAAARAAGLPANPPLKPSALDWLGDIPAHWEVKSLTRVTTSIRNGTSATQLEDESESAVPVTRIESISGGRINFDKVGQVEWTPTLERYRLKIGDILLSHINSLSMVGNCAIFDSDRPLYSGMNLLRIEPEPTVHAPWLWRVLSSDGIRKEISARAKPAINQASVTTTQIKALQLPLPPLSEQAAIAAYLDFETAKLDALVGKVEEAVERLQEYRTALITAAVTGKIDVRGSVATRPGKRVTFASP